MMVQKILSEKEILNLNSIKLEIFSDTIWEGVKLLDGIADNSNYLDCVGHYLNNLESPTYFFKEKNKKNFFSVKVCGRYQDWKLSNDVDNLVNDIDKPDFIFFNKIKNKIILAGETTDTISLGNSELQRKGRIIASAKKKIPFIYKTFGTKTDDSALTYKERLQGKIGEPRYLSSWSIIFHLILSIRYKVPSLLSIIQNPESDKKIDFKISNGGSDFFYDYISLIILAQNKNVNDDLNKILFKIFKENINYLKNSHGNESLIEKIKIEPVSKIIKNKSDTLLKNLIHHLNNNTKKIDETLKFTKWEYDSFFFWKNGYLTSNNVTNNLNWFFREVIKDKNIKSYGYKKTTSRICITPNTDQLIKLLVRNTKIKETELLKKLNINLPTLIIPTLAFQWRDINNFKVNKVDPGTGELCYFSEFFSLDDDSKKIANVLVYIYVKSPNNSIPKNKLFKAIKMYQDCLIINNKIINI